MVVCGAWAAIISLKGLLLSLRTASNRCISSSTSFSFFDDLSTPCVAVQDFGRQHARRRIWNLGFSAA